MKIPITQLPLFLQLFKHRYKFTFVKKVDNEDCAFLMKKGRDKVWGVRFDFEPDIEIHFKFFNKKHPDAVLITMIKQDFDNLLARQDELQKH